MICGRTVADFILHRKTLCHFLRPLFLDISFFLFFCILYFYLLGQMWQIKYKIHIKEYNNKENRFCLPQLPQPCKESPKALISRYFSRLLAIFLWQKPIRRGYSNLTQAPIQEADHRHQQESLHREPLWSSHRHPEVCADLPHNASKTLF